MAKTKSVNGKQSRGHLHRVVSPPSESVESAECPKCAGCGKIANDTDQTPWKYWMELPYQSAIAVQLGLVRPETCPRCAGTGKAG